MRPIIDRVIRAKSDTQDFSGFAQALCGESIRKDRSTKVPNHRCSSLFSLCKSHDRKLVNLSARKLRFSYRVFEAP